MRDLLLRIFAGQNSQEYQAPEHQGHCQGEECGEGDLPLCSQMSGNYTPGVDCMEDSTFQESKDELKPYCDEIEDPDPVIAKNCVERPTEEQMAAQDQRVAESMGVVGEAGSGADTCFLRSEGDDGLKLYFNENSTAKNITFDWDNGAINTWFHFAIVRSGGSTGVINFYEEYKDSLPEFPIKMKIRHLLVRIKAGEESKKAALSEINYLREKILNGASFSSVAVDFSDDPGSRASGGSLGFIKRNQMVKEFETKAYTQELNSLSSPIETTFGYHILETVEKSGEKIKVRHILISPEITEQDESLAYKYALSLRDSSKNLSRFKSLVINKSEDEQTKK